MIGQYVHDGYWIGNRVGTAHDEQGTLNSAFNLHKYNLCNLFTLENDAFRHNLEKLQSSNSIA